MGKIILGILVLGGAAFFIFSADKKEDANKDASEESSESIDNSEDVVSEESMMQDDTKEFNEKTTLTKLMEKGGNYQCTFSHSTQVGDSTGVVFISNKKIRGDFVSKVSIPGMGNTTDIETYMISDGESVYTWSSMSNDGFKSPVSKDLPKDFSTTVSVDQELDYKCVGWKLDESKFSLPTNITFKTM